MILRISNDYFPKQYLPVLLVIHTLCVFCEVEPQYVVYFPPK